MLNDVDSINPIGETIQYNIGPRFRPLISASSTEFGYEFGRSIQDRAKLQSLAMSLAVHTEFGHITEFGHEFGCPVQSWAT